MAGTSKPMTLIESNFHNAMEESPSAVKRFVNEFATSTRDYITSMSAAAGVLVPNERLDTLSRIMSIEILSKNTIFVGMVLDYAQIDGTTQQTKDWLSRYAPQAYKLLARRVMLGEKQTIRTAPLEKQMNALAESAYPEAERKIIILFGLDGSETAALLDSMEAATTLAKFTIIRLRSQRR